MGPAALELSLVLRLLPTHEVRSHVHLQHRLRRQHLLLPYALRSHSDGCVQLSGPFCLGLQLPGKYDGRATAHVPVHRFLHHCSRLLFLSQDSGGAQT